MHITEYQAGASAFLYRALSHADEEHLGSSVDRDASDVLMHKDSEEGSASYRRGRTVVRRRSGERVPGHVLQAKPPSHTIGGSASCSATLSDLFHNVRET